MEEEKASLYVYHTYIPNSNDTNFAMNNHHSDLFPWRKILHNQTVAL